MTKENATSKVIDINYKLSAYHAPMHEHKYGSRVHLLSDPIMQSVLARIGRSETKQPHLNTLMAMAYRTLVHTAINTLLPTEEVRWDTRMKEFCSEGTFVGDIIRPRTKSVVVDLARAGTFPSHLCYETLNIICEPDDVRQDHFYINRKTNDAGIVIGVDVSGSKIGGGQEDAFVFFPDPMGATGGSLSHCVQHYKEKVEGKARKYIALHLIVTPEYLKRVTEDHPDVEVFALRLDRGLSAPEILKTVPGTHWDKERGLTDNQYIVPGAGGVGEILNNSYV